ARRFAGEGASVAILDINIEAGRGVVADLEARGQRAAFFDCDVGKVEAVEAAVDHASDWLGGVDIVFANAAVGTIVVGGTIESIEPERWDLALGVNAGGVYALCRATLPHLRKAGSGAIVITSSSSALRGAERRPTHAYAAAKGALISLTRAMAVSYGPEGIRVNAVVPGLIRTRLTADILNDPEQSQAAIANVPLGRAAEPDEVASCVLFLASDEASYVTGTTIIVDGGMSLYPKFV
ncbi:MAG: SDR family NAD(P)-dependent oxidoreductase, partial [Gaiellaceae bacterium]